MDMEKAEERALNSSSPPLPTAAAAATTTKDTEAQIPPKPRSKHRRRNICLATTAAIIVTFVVIIVILAFTVFKPKDPEITMDSVSLENFKVDLDNANMRVLLNMTLDVDLTVTNENKVGLKYKNGSAVLSYRGEDVGDVPIPAGEIDSDDTRAMNVSVTVMADRLATNREFYEEVLSGTLTMGVEVKLSGKVTILNIFKISVKTTTTCDITIFVRNVTIADQSCNYKAKL